MVGLAVASQQPKTFRLTVQSKRPNAWIQLAAFDQNGVEYRSGGSGLEVPTDRPMRVEFDLAHLTPRDATTAPTKTPLVRIELIDTSHLANSVDSPNELYLDDIEIF